MQARFDAVRAYTLALAEPLSEEDCCAQSMADASPVKWHLAHTTWFFETFILERFEPDCRPFHPAFRVLFNSYYNGVGDKYPRPQRGMLTRPAFGEVLAYRRNVDERMTELLERRAGEPELGALLETGLQHEQQHQELILTDVKHLLSLNPILPAYSSAQYRMAPRGAGRRWLAFAGGVDTYGLDGSTQRTATFFPDARSASMRRSVIVDFPAPGLPVMPTTHALPVLGKSSFRRSR